MSLKQEEGGCNSDRSMAVAAVAAPMIDRNNQPVLYKHSQEPPQHGQPGKMGLPRQMKKNTSSQRKDPGWAASITYSVPRPWQAYPYPRCPPSLMSITPDSPPTVLLASFAAPGTSFQPPGLKVRRQSGHQSLTGELTTHSSVSVSALGLQRQ